LPIFRKTSVAQHEVAQVEDAMSEVTFAQLVDLKNIQQLLEANYRFTGIVSAILDTDENILVAVGWEDICTRFHRTHPVASTRCRESDACIKAHLHDFREGFFEYKCRNGLWDVAMPIYIGGVHLASIFTGQFFYDDDMPDREFFRSQAREFGFDEDEYLIAISRVQVYTREQVRSIMDFYRGLAQMMAEMGLMNLKLSEEVAEREKSEKELQESRDYLDSIINTIADPIFVKDRDKRLVLVNSAMCSISGYKREELIGRTCYDLFPGEVANLLSETDQIVFETGEENVNEYEITYSHGDRHAIVTKKSLYKDLDGNSYLVGIARDVTDLKRAESKVRELNEGLEQRVTERTAQLSATNERLHREIAERKRVEEELRESRLKYQAIIDAFDGLIYICSQDYHVEFMNKKLIDRTGNDAVGEFCYKVLHNRDSICPWCVNDRVCKGETVRWEMFSPKDNRWYYVVNVPIYNADGSMSKYSMIMDIHKRKLAEEQLKQQKLELEELNSTLEIRVQEEVAKNREMDIILIQQNRQAALGESLEHIAHQWKQPLNLIGLLIQHLKLSCSDGKLGEDLVDEAVSKTMALLHHMAQTIDVFRDFYRPDKEKTLFLLKESIDKTLSFIEPAFRHQNITVDVDADPELWAQGYPKEFVQVLLIILTNARDAFKDRKTANPRLAIKAFAEDKEAIVSITDNAGGVPDNTIGNIFDLYFTTREAGGGTGIGLYMAKSIIEKHMDGRLGVANVKDGAQFRIELNRPEKALEP
jgi:PAS domain S-box-containing protein